MADENSHGKPSATTKVYTTSPFAAHPNGRSRFPAPKPQNSDLKIRRIREVGLEHGDTDIVPDDVYAEILAHKLDPRP